MPSNTLFDLHRFLVVVSTELAERCSWPLITGNYIWNVWCLNRHFEDSDPNERMKKLLDESENLRRANEENHRFWKNNKPSQLTYDRLTGSIMPVTSDSEATDRSSGRLGPLPLSLDASPASKRDSSAPTENSTVPESEMGKLMREKGIIEALFGSTEPAGTIKKVSFSGANHIDREELERITGLKPGNPMSPMGNCQARKALIRAYQAKGRYWTTVRLIKGDNSTDDEVAFEIAEGPVVKLKEFKVDFLGQPLGDITTGRLRTKIENSSAFLNLIGGDFNPIALEMDAAKLTEYYRALGYLKARIQRELIWSEDHRLVTVVFHLEEGQRFKVNKLKIDGSKTADELKLMSYTDIRAGDYYERPIVDADLKRIQAYFGYQGRPTIVRESYRDVGNGLVDVHIQIKEGEPVRVSDPKLLDRRTIEENKRNEILAQATEGMRQLGAYIEYGSDFIVNAFETRNDPNYRMTQALGTSEYFRDQMLRERSKNQPGKEKYYEPTNSSRFSPED